MQKTPSTPRTEVLESRECWELLRSVSLGRLAVWTGDHPELFPVTYLVDQRTIVFRTGPGTKRTAALGSSPVAFETDGVDPRTNVAWSVIVKGTAAEVEQTDDSLSSSSRRLFPWESGEKDHFVRITPEVVTGRRFIVAHPQAWDISLNDATRSGLD
ncbi:pyridoxamine 5'-phosphate oxidase family protein [Nesterenkonia sp. LB17]|uniref:pyridoxamine 5'-phosphate oxidase family protein n=1 Tax=unclassified Nesterenkonia TaxID=2629769 RepID=UPI001F4C8167|nr:MULTISPECIES: pyridoxamine 5'-phosphate oxidase family protein [unclassified Nesterenkonia]MCH8561567.1 pyridoxamine 5'-phosphate oxidase family protein [Nesterenkonia sp. DZ6]MCH8564100.1 pyridoxamine 5'-phosphate oxidase family protein [Nesterenkonia sp. YGD6]MCH8566428.1 pyridoxamine 5'-phosphate oxidase family protein [Nesterenkonia sp. LB17]MCH8572156.1 pyridoxamine 5'-phosphate oxidase family protein [Nesterenkonia sp. AY15]